MKIVLAAMNAKYIHSNLAVYCLRSYCNKYKEQIEIAEYTINNQIDAIIGGIYKRKPDVIAFSCYIWNISMVYEVARELRKLMPEIPIWLGGPEVSYDAATVLKEHSYIDGVMVGEGEETFLELLDYLVEGKGNLEEIRGICYRKDTQVVETLPREQMNLSKVPFPYEDLEEFENKIIYYESSRGCPYTCSYCLSSIDKKVRLRNMDLVKRELQFFLERKVVQVKFVDRTFNCNREHTYEIWKYIHEHDNGVTNFHFEVSADILREEEIALLHKMRPGLVQLEIGVQSTNEQTIHAIRRKMDLEKLKKAVAAVKEGHNVHQHLDLIIGLPYEDYKTFARSFNEVYAMCPDQLQLGFLKVLKGSYMHECCEKYDIVYKGSAPYEVLYTQWISYDEVLRLKAIEEMVEVYYNSGQFPNTIAYLEHLFESPFVMYEKLADFYFSHELFERNHSRIQRFHLLLAFYRETFGETEQQVIEELLTFDCYLREKMKSRPGFAAKRELQLKEIMEQLEGQAILEEIITEDLEKAPMRKLLKVLHVEQFGIDVKETVRLKRPIWKEQVVLFDYNKRNPLNHDATTYLLEKA